MEVYFNEVLREVLALRTESEKGMQCRYFAIFDEDDISEFDAYLVGPYVGVYRFKLVKLHVSMSSFFPHVPPEVRFIHHTRHQIHPNFYVSGNTCLGLFEDAPRRRIGVVEEGTWYRMLRIWRPRMILHNMLLYIRTLLDDNPFKHEPWGQDKPELSHFVQYVTWDALFFRYLANETNNNALIWLKRYVLERGLKMLNELLGQQAANRDREYFVGPHHEKVPIDYPALIRRLGAAVVEARTSQLLSLTAGNSRQPMEEAAWTWAGRVSLKWSDLFSGHPHRDL